MSVAGYSEVILDKDADEDVNKVRKEETDWVKWREFFEQKKDEHPEWFKTACRNWAYTTMTLSSDDETFFNVIVGAQTGVTTTGKFDVKIEEPMNTNRR